MEVTIRKAEARDIPQMLALVKELAVFEKEPEVVTVTEAEMLDTAFGKHPTWFGWVAAGRDEQILGIAICYDRYSTWKGRCLYLEDIVVTNEMRGQGIGDRLFRECVKHAATNNYHAMRWQVLDWNEGAIRFYKRLGAEVSTGWLNGDLTKEQLQRLAHG